MEYNRDQRPCEYDCRQVRSQFAIPFLAFLLAHYVSVVRLQPSQVRDVADDTKIGEMLHDWVLGIPVSQ